MSVDLERLKADLAIAGIMSSRIGVSPYTSGERGRVRNDYRALFVEVAVLALAVYADGDVQLTAEGTLTPLDWTALAIIGRAVDQAVK